MCSEEYLIAWSDHQRSVLGIFGKFLDEDILVDCAVATEGKCLKAHRLMLSACSPYFEFLFNQEKNVKVVVLENLKFEDLKSLIQFMYQGQVTISKDRLRGFIRAAESLQIKGLPSDLAHYSQRESTELSMVCRKEMSSSLMSHELAKCSTVGGENSYIQCENLKITSTGRKQSEVERPFTCIQTDVLEGNVFPQQQSVLKTGIFPVDPQSVLELKQEIDVEDTAIWGSGENVPNFLSETSVEENQGERSPSDSACLSVPNVSSNGSVVEPIHELWMEEEQFHESDDENAGTGFGDIQSLETLNENLAGSSAASGDNQPVQPALALRASPSSCTVSQRNEKEVSVSVVKAEDPETQERCMEHEHKHIDINASVIERVVKKGKHYVVDVDENRVGEEEDKIELQGKMVRAVALEADIVVDDSEEEVDPAPLYGPISEMSEEESYRYPECPNVSHTVNNLQVNVKKPQKKERSNCCEVCKTVFASKSQLQRHMTKHTSEQLFSCDVCKMSFNYNCHLVIHMRTHTGERPFQCKVCKKSFGHSSSLRNHMRIHTGERPFQCEVCEMTFSVSSTLTKHMRTHTGERPFQCEICEKSFGHRSNLITHMRIHTGQHPFQCEVCEKSFVQSGSLKAHMQTHTGERPFQCEVCEKSFIQSSALKVHMRIHTGEHPFQCEVCEKSFNRSDGLRAHMLIHTGERPFQCEVCEKTFVQNSALTVHMRIHTGERPFQCEVCERTFGESGSFRRHMRIHTGERPFQCEVCEKSFIRSGDVRAHMLTHTRERPFQCAVCEKSFVQESRLRYHMWTHASCLPFQCEVCEKSFGHDSSLKKHMLSHTGEGPYQCEVCERSFTCREHLSRHLLAHTGERSFLCNVCEMSFARSDHLNKHLRTHSEEHSFQCGICKMSFEHKKNLIKHMAEHTGESSVQC